ncbi:MAG: hypothetical protein ABW034_10305 [Steroidobacteraceae bacterium]
MLPVELDESGADSSVLLMSELLLELSLLESIDPSELALSELGLLSLGMVEEDDEDAASSSGWLPLVLLRDSSTLALRDVVLVLVRVSVRAAPERSLVTAPMSELELELVLGTVALLLEDSDAGAAVDVDGEDVVERELS